MKDLSRQVLSIVKTLEADNADFDIGEFFEGVLDVNWVLNSDRTFKSARLLVAFGGPNIWIDTGSQTVEGYWWSDEFSCRYEDEAGLFDYCEEWFACT